MLKNGKFKGKCRALLMPATRLVLLPALFIFTVSGSIFATVNFQNLNVQPSTAAPGSYITINFQIQQTNSNQGRPFAIMLDQTSGTPGLCDTDFIAGSDYSGGYNRVYGSSGSVGIWYGDGAANGTTLAATARPATWEGEDNSSSGIFLPNTTNTGYISVTVVAKVPPEITGTYYVHIIAKDSNTYVRWDCLQDTTDYNTIVHSSAITISGTTTAYKLDLEMCYNTTDSTHYYTRYRIVNRSESSVPINMLSYKFWWYDLYTTYQMSQTRQQRVYSPSNTQLRNGNLQPSNTDTFAAVSVTNCGSNRIANNSYRATFSETSQVPANGGYISNYSYGDIGIRRGDSGAITKTDDYWRESDLTSGCGSYPTTDTKYAAVYYNSVLACEYDDSSTVDDLTGEEPCGISACSTSPIEAAKSVNVTTACVGDAVTFCITATNTGASAETFDIWDTVPTGLTYVGCDNSCTQSGGVVSWTVTSLAASGSVTRCFWATVNSIGYFDPGAEMFAGLKKRDYAYFYASGFLIEFGMLNGCMECGAD